MINNKKLGKKHKVKNWKNEKIKKSIKYVQHKKSNKILSNSFFFIVVFSIY